MRLLVIYIFLYKWAVARLLSVTINLLLKFIEIHGQEVFWVMDQRLAMVML